MADGYMIPPWLSNLPSPVDSYSRGLQIGASVGQDQARQQLAQEQMLREEQKAAVEQEIDKATFQLKSDAAARRYAAQKQFENAINSGVDPAMAALKYGPEMGVTGPALAQFSKSFQKAPLEVQEQDGEKFLRTGPGSWQHIPTTATKDITPKEITIGGKTYIYNPNTGAFHPEDDKPPVVTTPLDPSNIFGPTVRGSITDPRMRQYLGTNAPPLGSTSKSSAKSKVARAKELSAQHPDWTKDKVIAEVNKEFSGAD